jgi:hypothetical protein
MMPKQRLTSSLSVVVSSSSDARRENFIFGAKFRRRVELSVKSKRKNQQSKIREKRMLYIDE